MKLLAAKFGSKATPSKPRSPVESTVSVRNGVANRDPFLITRNCPPCRQTNRRPSGAKSIAVGLVRLFATIVSENPGGKVAAKDARQVPTINRQEVTTNPIAQC